MFYAVVKPSVLRVDDICLWIKDAAASETIDKCLAAATKEHQSQIQELKKDHELQIKAL